MAQAATGWMECTVESQVETGDHVLVTARVQDAAVTGSGPTLTLAETGWRYSG
jgi:flavin reductase (DIM6/NTAB) family NADH-FMN oxidoreductase RutF